MGYADLKKRKSPSSDNEQKTEDRFNKTDMCIGSCMCSIPRGMHC